MTEKVRTYTCSEKTGAYSMIQGICEKFVAYPVYHGDTMTVDIFARANHPGMMEMSLNKNLSRMSRLRDSSDLITRLYVEGEYGDLGYVGIDDVNPTGLPYLLNFDYYQEIGAMTPEQVAAVQDYITNSANIRGQISTKTQENETKITQLVRNWGAQGYVLYPVRRVSADLIARADYAVVNTNVWGWDGQGDFITYDPPVYGSGATEDDAMVVGDTVASVTASGSYSYAVVESMVPPDGQRWAIKFLTPMGGILGGKEVAIEAKQETAEGLRQKIAAATSDLERQSLQGQLDVVLSDISTLTGERDALTLECITLATEIGATGVQIEALQKSLAELESWFSVTMGDLLQDGYYSDNTYAPGQEQALYNDAVELLKVMSRPQHTYTLNEIDIANTKGYSDEIYTMNIAVHFYNKRMGINDYGFVSQISEYLDRANTRSVKIQTDEMNIQGKSFAAFLGRITDAAQVIKDQQSIFERAKALSKDGTFGTDKLNGIIDVLQNRLLSTVSNWYTDDNGNLIFVAADESNAMMLSGNGFMVANGKTASGRWNWRTFGTGEGFTADLITAGVLQAGMITILGSDQFYWTGDNMYVVDPNNDSNQIRIGRYDGIHLGIGYTTDGGVTWQNAIGFDGVHLSGPVAELDAGGKVVIDETGVDISGVAIDIKTSGGASGVNLDSDGVDINGGNIEMNGGNINVSGGSIDLSTPTGTSSVTLDEDGVDITGGNINISNNDASIMLDPLGVQISGGYIHIETTDKSASLSVDGSGIVGSSIIAPNVSKRYVGPTAITVRPDAESAKIETGEQYRTLADLTAQLNGMQIDSAIYIGVRGPYGNPAYNEIGSIQFRGISGSGVITIQGASAGHPKITGRLLFTNVSVPVFVRYIDVDVPETGGNGIWVQSSPYVSLYTGVISYIGSGSSTGIGVYVDVGGSADVRGYSIYNMGRSLMAASLGKMYSSANKGNAALATAYGGQLMANGSQPSPTTTLSYSADPPGTIFLGSDVIVDMGGTSPTPSPSVPGTYQASPAATSTYCNGWAYPNRTGTSLYQGLVNTGVRTSKAYGVMWFGSDLVTNLTGKTITQATLGVYQNGGVGRGVYVYMGLAGTTAADGSGGEPPITKSYGVIGRTEPSTYNTLTIPVEAIQDLVAGTISGLMLVSDDTSLYEGRGYSKNYTRYNGTEGAAGTVPVLTVDYTTP